MLVVISVSYDRFLVLLCHDQQEFLQGIFGMQMLLGQDWVKRVQFYVACHGMFRIFFCFGCIFRNIFLNSVD